MRHVRHSYVGRKAQWWKDIVGNDGVRSAPKETSSRSFLAELWRFIRVRKKYWLLPILLMVALFGGLIVLTQGSAVAPFIYTLF